MMKQNKVLCHLATGACALALFVGQVSAQLPCYGPWYQPKFPANAEKLMRK